MSKNQNGELSAYRHHSKFPGNFQSFHGVVPKWLKGAVCKTVIRRFESGRRLIFFKCPGGGIGRHYGLKIHWQ